MIRLLDSNDNKAFSRQLSMVLITCFGMFMAGCVNGWIAPALSRLLSGEEAFQVTTEEASWLALYPEFGHFLAPIPAGVAADYVGRKPMFAICSLLVVMGWSAMSYSSDLTYFCVGRTILGFSFGAQATLAVIYVAEISDKKWRGAFGSMILFFLNVGVLFQFVIGSYFCVHTTVLITAIIGGAHLLLTAFVVESPYYLLTQADETGAKENLSWLRASDRVNDEFDGIRERVVNKVDLITAFANLKASSRGFSLCFVLSFLAEMTGRIAILTYATRNFQAQGVMSANRLTILLGIFNVLLPIVPVVLSDRVGRRLLILVSTAIAGIMHLSTGSLYFFHSIVDTEIPFFGWLLLFTITANLCCSSVFMTNTLMLRGELLAENSRGLASGFASMGFAIACVISIKLFQMLSDYSGNHSAFWALGGFCFVFIAVTWVFLPETKNKTFEEIQKSLENVREGVKTGKS